MHPETLTRRMFMGVSATASGAALLTDSRGAEPSTKERTLPDGVHETVGALGSFNSLVELKDGSLLANDGRTSRDGGKSWTAPRAFGKGIAGAGLLRLQGGALALVSQVGYASGKLWLSRDEGKSWKLAGTIRTPGGPVYELGDTLIQLKSGRLLSCWDYNMAGNHPGMEYHTVSAYGTWKGKRYQVEGHGHLPEFFASGLSWSDDEGKTWKVGTYQDMPNVLMGWFDEKGEPTGRNGISPCGEASLAETKDGRILLFGRSTVGRIVQSYSKDGGERWLALRPSGLAASNSPPRLRRIPKSGDLLCVWNQVSGEEIRKGFRRSRLSAAVSKDGGATWGHFKTIEACEGLAEAARVRPEAEVRDVRARQDVGRLPDGFAYYHYPNVCFAGKKVFVMYSRGYPEMGVAEQVLHRQQQVLRSYPLDWFYQ
ncbi:MAG: exo-alpha-sialidase [Planctomycetes bacterium]|nr:exo-alpha-sialidase [Planctomycetota bacterium]